MQMTQEKFIVPLLLLLLTIIIATTTTTSPTRFSFTESAQIPARFYYDNSNNNNKNNNGFSEDHLHRVDREVDGIDGAADGGGSSGSAATDGDGDGDGSSFTSVHLLKDNDATETISSMEFYKELNNVTDLSEFIERFVEKDSIDPQLGIQENLKRNVERAAAISPKRASCIPDNTIVPLTPLNPSRDPNVSYFPECTRVKRCGGCCTSALISCQPTDSEVINFEVTKYMRMPNGKLRLNGKEIIVIEQHTKCVCDCRIKAENCNSYQIYRKDLCRCECKNNDAREKCLGQEHKIWDEQACRCVCRDNQSCTTGTVFDETQCKCTDPKESNGSASPSLLDRRRFILQAIPVEIDNSTIYSV